MPLVLFHRIAHWLHRARVPLAPRLFVLAGRVLFHGYVGAGARIGRRVSLGYWGLGVVIHDRAVLGDDVRVGCGVVIGGRSKQHGVPVIGDRVVLGAGAKVLGPITIGDEAVIGANAVVVADVAPRTVVGGVPARVLKREIDVRDFHDGFERDATPDGEHRSAA